VPPPNHVFHYVFKVVHTIILDLVAFDGVILVGPRVAEKHWGEGGFVRICSRLSSLLCFTLFKSREIGTFSASSALLHR